VPRPVPRFEGQSAQALFFIGLVCEPMAELMPMSIMPPHIIMQGMPISIILIMFSQHILNMSADMPSIGIMVQVMEPSAAISQDMRHIMPGIIPPICIWGIMPPIIGIIPPICIGDIMPPIMGIMPPIGIGGTMPGIILPIMGIAAVLVIQLSHSLIGNPPASPLGRRKG
jgi:hypothetical protein